MVQHVLIQIRVKGKQHGGGGPNPLIFLIACPLVLCDSNKTIKKKYTSEWNMASFIIMKLAMKEKAIDVRNYQAP